ncbi:MAG: methionine aminopeptidase [Actinomycetota bacterium]|nr:methionine aminopeptidase [Actinomycetota bacterium]
MQYWYNIDSGQVETDENKSQGAKVMGPYATADEAGHALQSARERTEKWDAEDKEWGAAGEAKS